MSAGNTAAAEAFTEQTDAAGNTAYASIGEYDGSGYATLTDGLVPEVTSTVNLSDFFGAVSPQSGVLAFIGGMDGEICVVESGDGNSTVVRRGMFDTIPKDWPSSTAVWFVDWDSSMAGPTVVVGESKTYRLAPPGYGGVGYRTAGETFSSRHYRPYRPANVRVNGVRWPQAFTGELSVSWSHRNRQVENSVPLKWDEVSVTPESGTAYTFKVYDQLGGLLTSETGLTDDTYTLTAGDEAGGGGVNDKLTFELEAVRDGYGSFQKIVQTVDRAGYGFHYGKYYGGI